MWAKLLEVKGLICIIVVVGPYAFYVMTYKGSICTKE